MDFTSNHALLLLAHLALFQGLFEVLPSIEAHLAFTRAGFFISHQSLFKMFGIWTEIWTSRGSVEDLEDSEQLLRDSQLYSDKKRQSARVRRYPSWSLLLVAFFCTSIVSAAFGAWMAQFRRPDADAFCIPHISQYCESKYASRTVQYLTSQQAPIVKDVGITYSPVKFNGSLLVSNDFRLDAGPQVDAAWKSLGVDCRIFRA